MDEQKIKKNNNKKVKEKDKKNINQNEEEKELQEENNLKMIFEESFNGKIKFTKKILGKGSCGKIYDILFNNSKSMAGKIIKNSNELEQKDELFFSTTIKGSNVIKQHDIFHVNIGNDAYDLILMEKADLSDLSRLIDHIKNRNYLKTIYTPFKTLGDNFLRFITRQMVRGVENIRRYGFVHFDIKPENFLVTNNLTIKLTDYSIMKYIKEEEDKMKIPGGTNGFISPEYYKKTYLDKNVMNKIDIYGLGACLYLLKTGEKFLDLPKNNQFYLAPSQKEEKIKYQYERKIKKINSLVNEGVNEDLIELLKNTLKYYPENIIDFEFIYKNKWINKYNKELQNLVDQYENDEITIIMELQKSDVLFRYYEEEEKDKNILSHFTIAKKDKKYKRNKKN